MQRKTCHAGDLMLVNQTDGSPESSLYIILDCQDMVSVLQSSLYFSYPVTRWSKSVIEKNDAHACSHKGA